MRRQSTPYHCKSTMLALQTRDGRGVSAHRECLKSCPAPGDAAPSRDAWAAASDVDEVLGPPLPLNIKDAHRRRLQSLRVLGALRQQSRPCMPGMWALGEAARFPSKGTAGGPAPIPKPLCTTSAHQDPGVPVKVEELLDQQAKLSREADAVLLAHARQVHQDVVNLACEAVARETGLQRLSSSPCPFLH